MNVLHSKSHQSIFPGTIKVSLILTLGLLAARAQPLSSQPLPGQHLLLQDRGPVQRVVHGKVEDKGGAPVKGAVVYLQDGRSSSVRSAITGDDGSYRFVQLSQSTDYELWAKLNAKKSKSKSISSFDNKNDFTIDLKIDD